MKPVKWIGIAFILALIFSLTGCLTNKRLAVNKAHAEFDCPKEEIEVKDIGKDRYRVLACGNIAIYVCDNLAKACMKEGDLTLIR